MFKIFRS